MNQSERLSKTDYMIRIWIGNLNLNISFIVWLRNHGRRPYSCVEVTFLLKLGDPDRGYSRGPPLSINDWFHRNLHPVSDTIEKRSVTFSGQYWREKDEIVNEVLLWVTTRRRASRGRQAEDLYPACPAEYHEQYNFMATKSHGKPCKQCDRVMTWSY